jgi:flagellin-like hook-associated protein FlgL
MDGEFSEMAAEIERISGAITFNSITMLDSDSGSVSIHVGTTETIDINNVDMSKEGLGIETGSGGVYIIGNATQGKAAATTAAWTTLSDSTDADATLTISFEDSDAGANDELDIEVTFAAASGGTAYTLQEIVDDINLISENLGNDADGNNLNYAAASVQTVLDGSTVYYTLKLSSRDATSNVCEMAYTSTGNTTAEHAWTVPADIDGTDFTAEVTDDGINILTADAAATALIAVTAAIEEKDTARAQFGYKMTRLESTVDVLGIQAENLIAAESRISDVDVATEMAVLTRTQVLAQAGIAMLAQANSMPQMALALLR